MESSGESLRQATCDARLARVDSRHAATCAMHHALALYVLCASLVRSAANSRLPTMNALILTVCVLHSGGQSNAAQRPEAASAVTTIVDAPVDNLSGGLSGEQAILLLLRECGSWWKINGKRPGLAWSFLVPSDDDVLDTAAKGLALPKQHGVCCWLCYLEHHGKLHSNYPIPPDSDDGQERNIDEAMQTLNDTQYLEALVDRANIMVFDYKFTSGSTNLRHHVSKHHGKWYAMLQAKDGTDSEATLSQKRTAVGFLSSMFKPMKRLKDDEPRQKLFVELLTYVIVFLRWSFSVVDNQWFRAFVCNYPMLAQLARICLACPGSQIENERVFSLCGLTVSNLRNRMTTDNLAEVVYLTKNTCPEETVSRILTKAYGHSTAHNYLYQRDETNRLTNMPRHEQSDDDESSDVEVEVEAEASDASDVPVLAYVAATHLDDANDESSGTEASEESATSGGSFDDELGM